MEFVAPIASASDLPIRSDNISTGGLRIGSGIGSNVVAICAVIRFPTPGTGLRAETGFVVKNGCAKRYTSAVFILVFFTVFLDVALAFLAFMGSRLYSDVGVAVKKLSC